MAMRVNPITGRWEDDTTGGDALAGTRDADLGIETMPQVQPLPMQTTADPYGMGVGNMVGVDNAEIAPPKLPRPEAPPSPDAVTAPTGLPPADASQAVPPQIAAQAAQLAPTSVVTNKNASVSYSKLSKADQAKQDQLEREQADLQAKRESDVGAEVGLKQSVLDAQRDNAEFRAMRAESERQWLRGVKDEHDQKIAAADAEVDLQLGEQRRLAKELGKDYWADKGTGARVAAAFLTGIGEFGAGLAQLGGIRQQSLAKAQIDAEIERDTQRKVREYEAQKDTVSATERKAGRARENRRTAIADYELEKAARYEATAAMMEQRLLEAGANAPQIEGNRLLNEVKAEGVRWRQAAIDKRRQNVVSETKSQILQGSMFAGLGDMAPKDPLGIYGPGGVMLGRVADKKTAEETNESLATYRSLRSNVVALAQRLSTGATVNPVGQELKDRRQLQADILSDVSKLKKLGTWDNGTERLLTSLVGDKLDLMRGNPKQAQNLLTTVDVKMVNGLDSRGLRGADLVGKVVRADMAGAQPAPGQPQAGGMSVQQAVELARARLAKDPNDAKAKAVLQRYGGQ